MDDLSRLIARHDIGPKRLGELGERIAERWLEAQGHTIIGRNWHSRYGELDLIVMDRQRTLLFVEVKTRRSTRFGIPQEAVTARKRAGLRRTGVQWLLDPGRRIPHRGVRFDVISILAPLGQPPHIAQIKEAF
ncbi:YraN family protein [Bifidobacterium aerophilum]|uniref:UPF0102 protein GFD25_06405 n=2 Tax=Bifidobacterium aerophilum TaxID=1798155 RepID=A0A6N9Z551_9BIFI|nr:YraN family protein [Bifidobacterium aerophilum]